MMGTSTSLNLCTMAWHPLMPSSDAGFQLTSHIWASTCDDNCMMIDDGSICPSTAYEDCQTPFIYITLMRDEYGLGVQPQSLHFTITYRLGVAHISSKIPKAWSE